MIAIEKNGICYYLREEYYSANLTEATLIRSCDAIYSDTKCIKIRFLGDKLATELLNAFNVRITTFEQYEELLRIANKL